MTKSNATFINGKALALLAAIMFFNTLAARNARDTLGVGKLITFTENRGQWDSRVLFRSQMRLSTLFVERDCFTLVVQHPDNACLQHPIKPSAGKRHRTHSYRMRFEGASCSHVEGSDRQPGYENYFIGRDRSQWASNVHSFGSVIYHSLYKGIDLKVHSASNAMKYDFIVEPHADPSQIAISYEGTDNIKIKDGNIIVHTSVLDIIEMKPFAYQIVDGRQVEVRAKYVINRKSATNTPDRPDAMKTNVVNIELGEYDTSRTLIIDPYLYFSTYTGSTADNWGTTGCYDSYKNTYTSGVVFGQGYPVSTGAYDGSYNGNCDIGIFKFDTTGSTRLYATYLGGSLADMPHSMFVNSLDELVIFGTTGSANFPVTDNAYDTSFNGGDSLAYEGSSTIHFRYGSDIFICRFSSDGSQLQASTFVGGSGNDGLNYRNNFDYATIMLGNDSLYFNYGDGARGEIMTDDMNNIYVGSSTTSTDFPVTANCIQSTCGGRQDGVVFKIDYNLSHIMWSTYLGGGKDDAIYSVDCDNEYNVVVCGGTNSLNFPTTSGSYDHSYNGGSADGFITKISYYGSTMMASTYFGSGTYDQFYFVRCSKNGDIFTFGQTKAAGNHLIHNANYSVPGSGQLLTRFSPLLDTLRWSTVFGTGDVLDNGPNISPTAFAVDICNRVYVSGWGRIFLGRYLGNTTYPWNTHGTTNMPVSTDAYQSVTDGQDFYIMSLDMDANDMVYATYFGELHNEDSSYYSGGDHVDGGTSRFDRLGTLYQSVCASCGNCDWFPTTTNAYSHHNNSNNCNNAIFRLNLTDDFPVAEFNYSRSSECNPTTISFHNTGRGDSYLWDFGDGTTSTEPNPSHNYPFAGFYTVRLIAYMSGGCRESDTVESVITILAGTNVPQLDTLSTCPGSPIQIGVHPEVGLTYHWIEGAVSDSNIANPMADQPGIYRVWIMTGDNYDCGKLLTQVLVAGESNARIVGDSIFCSVPDTITLLTDGPAPTYIWSSHRDYSDTLNNDIHSGLLSFIPHDGQWLYSRAVDALGCYKNDSIQVHFYHILDTIETTPPLCPGLCEGSATVHSTSLALAPLQFDWGAGWIAGDSIHTLLCPGYHTVTMRDAKGCTVSSSITIPDAETPTIDAAATHIHCHESCTGTIDITVTGNSTYSLLWLDDSSSAYHRDSLCAGSYILQVQDSNGCIFLDTITIHDNIDIALTIEVSRNSCGDICSGIATVSAAGGEAPYSYAWSSGEDNATAEHLCEGMQYIVVTDAYGCEARDSVMIERQHSFDSVHAWADEYLIFSGNSTTLHVTHIPGATYWWSPSDKLNNASSADPVATLTDTTLFTVTITDTAGCTYQDTVEISCVTVGCGKMNLFIPNAFTPNGDGKNDQLCFSGEWIDDFHITIFTRWGEKVYESDNMSECWDGRFRDNWCMPGVYVYHCRIKCQDGKSEQLKGDITLIR